ncbi:unnamed protein product [Urochloa humidicola]
MDICVHLVEDLGLDVNSHDKSGQTPLVTAVIGDYVDIVKYLLKHGASPNIFTSGENGRGPLHFAAEKGNCEMVTTLLSKGANVNSICQSGTPLHVAASNRNDGVVQILLDNQADCDIAIDTGSTPLFLAVLANSLKCVELLIKAGANLEGDGKAIPLLIAVSEGFTDCLKYLLQAGADPNVANNEGMLAVEIAARKNNKEVVELLLPRTNPAPHIHDWSVDGVLHHVNAIFFCMECSMLLNDQSAMINHCGYKHHSKFGLAGGDTIELFCSECNEDFVSRAESVEHTKMKGHEEFYLKEAPNDGSVTPPFVGPYEDFSIIGPHKGKRRVVKFTEECQETARRLSFEDPDDNASSQEEKADLDESVRTYRLTMSLQGLSDDDSDYEDDMSLDSTALVQMRTLKSLGIRSKARRKLRERFVIAEGISKTRALVRAKRASKEYTDLGGHFIMPHETKNNEPVFVFHDDLKLVLMEKKGCYKTKPELAKRMKLVLDMVTPSLANNEEERARENMIHYLYPTELKEKNSKGKPLSEGQVKRRVSEAVNLLSRRLKISRESLNISASPKGRISGPVCLYVDQKVLTDCNNGGSSGNIIASESDLVTDIVATGQIKYVLLVEKETIFQYLASKLFHERECCILITGKGEPDVATRILLRKLRDKFSTIPFYGLFDCNPHGLQILSTYCFGSMERAHDGLRTNVPDIKLLGLFLKDVVDKKDQMPLGLRDQRILGTLIKQGYFSKTKYAFEMEMFLGEIQRQQKKADLEVLVKKGTLVDYIRRKIEPPQGQLNMLDVLRLQQISLRGND